MAFTGREMQAMVEWGVERGHQSTPELHRIVERVKDLRGTSITWVWGLRLGELLTWSVRTAQGSNGSLAAPLTFFKIEHFLWVPKVVIRVCRSAFMDWAELSAYHVTCRRASIEFMSITEDQVADGYLDSNRFRRGFNGAYFCDRVKNRTIFCPTLRGLGCCTWD